MAEISNYERIFELIRNIASKVIGGRLNYLEPTSLRKTEPPDYPVWQVRLASDINSRAAKDLRSGSYLLDVHIWDNILERFNVNLGIAEEIKREIQNKLGIHGEDITVNFLNDTTTNHEITHIVISLVIGYY